MSFAVAQLQREPQVRARTSANACWMKGKGTLADSFYWYDLETSGIEPRWDRILQFAGLRTGPDLEPAGDEFVTYIQLPDDVLPDPDAALVTGITPQRTRQEGISEWAALTRINALLSVPGTCVAGYNNLRFDDEFIRHSLYRNLMDPYAREWQGGNSRWDLMDLVRAAGALRPEGIEWPRDDHGLPVYSLSALTEANGLEHGQAHDALSDVTATVALARLLKEQQPKLFAYFLGLRFKRRAADLLLPLGGQALAHVSGKYPRHRFGLAPVVSVCRHPANGNSFIVADLGEDVEALIEWDAYQIREALFAAEVALRPPLKEIRLNKCPFIAPLSVIRPADAARLGYDAVLVAERFERLRRANVERKIEDVYRQQRPAAVADVEAALYDGFLGDDDRDRCLSFNQALAEGRWLDLDYDDARLPELARRVKARSFSQRLTDAERAEWRDWVVAKLQADPARWRTMAQVETRLEELQRQGVDGGGVLRAIRAHLDGLREPLSCALPSRPPGSSGLPGLDRRLPRGDLGC